MPIQPLLKHQFSLCLIFMSCSSNLFAHDEAVVQQATSIQPYTRAEIQTALQSMQQHMNQKIEAWGKTLTQNDFERTWRGRELTKAKRQEVCGIYQSVVNDMYNAAYINRGRLSIAGQKLLQDRNAFIQSLGFKDNRIDTQMGFYCRLR